MDGGATTLVSPRLDFSGGDGWIRYQRWMHGERGADEALEVEITSDGTTWSPVERITRKAGGWRPFTLRVSDHVRPSDRVQLRFRARDADEGTLLECALDDFRAERFVDGGVDG